MDTYRVSGLIFLGGGYRANTGQPSEGGDIFQWVWGDHEGAVCPTYLCLALHIRRHQSATTIPTNSPLLDFREASAASMECRTLRYIASKSVNDVKSAFRHAQSAGTARTLSKLDSSPLWPLSVFF